MFLESMRISGADHESDRNPSHFGSYTKLPLGQRSETLASIVSRGGAKGWLIFAGVYVWIAW